MSKIKSLESLEFTFIGSFEESIEIAQNSIADEGSGSLIVHRVYPIDHTNSDSCICSPIIISDGITLKTPAELYQEIEECQA